MCLEGFVVFGIEINGMDEERGVKGWYKDFRGVCWGCLWEKRLGVGEREEEIIWWRL